MFTRRGFIKGLAALLMAPRQALQTWQDKGERICSQGAGTDDAELKMLLPGEDLADHYPPGTIVWITDDAGYHWHEKIVQCRGHRWKRGKR